MATNRVTFTLQGKDNFSGTLDKLESRLGGIGLKSNLMASAITSGIQTAMSAVNKLGSILGDSINIQQQNISTAGDIMKLTGQNFSQASEYIDSFTQRMSKVAASLPGATSDYVDLGRSIMDNVIPAFKDMNGVIDTAAMTKGLDSITKNAGLRGSTTKVDTALTSPAISKALGGTASESELAKLKFFEANPAVLAFIQQEAKKLGKGINDLTARERFEVLDRALKVPDEVIKASQNSISGLTESFKSLLFDPTSGLFGFMRDLDPSKGKSSVLLTLQQGLKVLIGEDGLFNQIGTTLSILGISLGDPMVGLQKGIKWFTDKLDFVRDVFQQFNLDNTSRLLGEGGVTLEGSIAKVKEGINHLFDSLFGGLKNLPALASAALNRLTAYLNTIDWSAIGIWVGVAIGNLFDGLAGFLAGINWASVAILVTHLVVGIFQGLNAFLSNMDASTYLVAGLALIGATLVTLIGTGLLVAITAVVASFGAIPLAIGAAITLLLFGAVKLITDHGDQIKQGLSNVLDSMGSLWQWMQDRIDGVKAGFGLKTSGQERADAANQASTDRLNGALKDNPQGIVQGYPRPEPVANRANGQNLGLLDAFNREKVAMPAGSQPVVANSSELILNRTQLNSLSAGNSSNLTIGTLNIHSAAADAKSIADDVMAEIAHKWQAFQRSRLAAS